MTNVPEQISALGKAQVETALRLVTIAAEGTDRLFELQIKNSKAAFNEGIKNAKVLADVKDLSELPTWTTSTFQPAIDKANAYARSIYEVAAGVQSDIGAAVEVQITNFSKDVGAALDTALKSAPAGSESAAAAMKSAFGTANTMYENIVKASKQMAAIAEANLTSAISQAGVAFKNKSA